MLLLPLLAAVLALGMTLGDSARARPEMRAIETPLEGTNVISMRVNRNGIGRIELWCHRCRDNRIRLRITPESEAFINGAPVPFNTFSPGERDFISGFYRAEDKVLTRLTVKR